MNKKLKEDYIKYLHTVCDDEIIFDIASKYIEDLSKLYKNKYFTIKDFQQLNIDNKVYNQDIVNDMFTHRKMLKAEEIFYYLFTHHVKKIKFAQSNVLGKGVAGKTFLVEKNILLNQKSFTRTPKIKCLDKKYKINSDSYLDDILSLQNSRIFKIIDTFSTKINHLIQRDSEYDYKYLKKVIYHEFSHIFEVKTFNKVQYFNHGMMSITDILNPERSMIPFKISNSINNQEFINDISGGLRALSEIYNEIFSAKILKDEDKSVLKNKDMSVLKMSDINYIQKYTFNHNSFYQINYEIVKLINLLMFDNENEEDMYRFNFSSYYKKMKQIEVSPEVLKKLKTMYMFLISAHDEKFKDKKYFNEYYECLKECNIPCFIFILMVGKHYLDNNYFLNKKQSFYQYKFLLQELLVDALSNKIEKQLKDCSVIKDYKYFERLEQTLQTIDNFILLPNQIINYDIPIIRKTEVHNMSVKQYAEKYKDKEYIQKFYSLIQTVEKFIDENSDALTTKQKDMQFFKDQEKLDLRYMSIQNKLQSPVNKLYVNAINRIDKTIKGIKTHLNEYKKTSTNDNNKLSCLTKK